MKRLSSLQFIRVIACAMIIYSHLSYFLPSFTELGGAGVSIFIALSGFCIGLSEKEKNNCGNYSYTFKGIKGLFLYVWKKVSKMYPLHVLTFLAAVPFAVIRIIQATDYIDVFMTGLSAICNILLIQSWIPSSAFYYGYNGVSWYLSMICVLYFFAPLLVRIGKAFLSKVNYSYIYIYIYLGVGYLLMILLAVLMSSDDKWYTYISPLYRLIEFSMAIVCGIAFSYHKSCISAKKVSLITIIVPLVLYVMILSNIQKVPECFSASVVYVPVSLLLISVFYLNREWLSKFTDNRCMLHMADLTLDMFLIHQIIIRYAQTLCEKVAFISKNVMLMLVLGGIILLAEILHRLRERRSLIICWR